MNNLKNISGNYSWLFTIILLLAVLLQVGYKIGDEQIKVWDESSGARGSVAMLGNENYLVVMKDNGSPDHLDTKPPLAMWVKVISYKLFGVNEFAVRFPTLISAMLTALLLVLFLGVYHKKIWLANILLIIMVCTPGYMGYHVARHGDPDTLLTLFTTSYSIFFFILLDKYPVSKIKYLILTTISLVFAYYTKSIAGLAPAAGLVAYTLTRKNGYKLLMDYRLYLAGLSSIIIIGLYYLLRNIYDEGFLSAVYRQEFLIINNYPGTPKHPESGFYISYLWNNAFKPFSYYTPIAIIPMLFGKDKTIKNLITFSGIFCIVYIFGQSSIVIKNEWYIAPVYPFLWILLASGLYGTFVILLEFIKNQKAKSIVSILLFAGLIIISYPLYTKVFNRNQKLVTKIYSPEREGHFIRTCKKEIPQLRNYKVISPNASRSTSFYSQKYKYLEGASIELFRTQYMPQLLAGDTILVCDNETKLIIDSLYSNIKILEGRYCNLFVIKDKIKYSEERLE